MSKFGRQPIFVKDVMVNIVDNVVNYKGKNSSGSYLMHNYFTVKNENGALLINPKKEFEGKKDLNAMWGLHRSLLNNTITGSHTLFERTIKIDGLGFKATIAGDIITFLLGFSHKKTFKVPKGISVDIDKTGQTIILKSFDKMLVGQACSDIKSLRPTEPYKLKGIKLSTDVFIKKVGKKA